MADDAITRQLQRRAPSDGFRRAGSGASVTFDHDAWGGLARVPSITRTGSGGSKSSAKAKFQRAASTFARVSSKGSGVAAGGTAGWAKLRAAAALASASAPVEQDGFSRLPSGFQRVPSANAPGSLGIIVPLTFAETLTEEHSMGRPRAEIRKWKEDQTKQVHEKIADLEARMGRLSVLDNRLNGAKDSQDVPKWSDILPGAVPDKIETETQKYMLAKQASNTVRRIVVGDLDIPDDPWEEKMGAGQEDLAAEGEPEYLAEEEPVASKPSTANTQVAGQVIEFGWQDGKDSQPTIAATSRSDGAGSIEEGGDGSDEERAQFPKLIYDCCDVSLPLLCGGFSQKSIVRNFCFDIYNSRYAQAAFQLVWLANVLFVAASPELNRVVVSDKMSVSELAALVFNFVSIFILFVEVATGIIALGLQGSPGTWLRVSVFHKIDVVVFLVCILEVIASISGGVLGFQAPTLRPFRLLRVFQFTYLTKLLKDFEVIFFTLERCSGQLMTISLICLFYFAVFAIFGMAMYQSSFRRTCVMIDRDLPSCASDFSSSWKNTCSNEDFVRQLWVNEGGGSLYKPSSGYPYDKSCKYWDVADKAKGYTETTFEGKFPMDAVGRYHTCQLDEFRKDGAGAVKTECKDMSNPMNGFMHFDHIGSAMAVVFQISVADGQYEPLARALETQPFEIALTAIYFGGLVSAFTTFMHLGLYLAIIVKAYGAATEAHRAKLMRVCKTATSRPVAVYHKGSEWLLQLHVFRFLAYLAIILQMTVLAVYGHGMKESRKLLTDFFGNESALWHLYLACNFFFAVEASLKFASVSFSPRRYVQEPGNILWLSVLVLSVVGFVLAYPERLPRSWIENLGTDETTIKQLGMALRAIDSLRMYRLMALLPTLNRILSETMDSLRSIFNVTVFLFLCTFCTAVCGMYLIGDSMTGRSNFSSLFSAMLTSFQIFTGDSWTSVLYDAMAAGQSPFWSYINAAFVVVWLIFSIFVIGNLFISAIVTYIQVSQTMQDIEGPGYQKFVSTTLRANYREFIKWKNSIQLGRSLATTSMHNSDSSPPKSPKTQLSPMFSESFRVPSLSRRKLSIINHKLTERTNIIIKIVQDRSEGLESPREKQLQNTSLHSDFEEPVLCGFSSTFFLRKICIYFDQHPLFDGFIMLIVVASCIILVISPQYPDVPGAKPIIPYEVSGVLNIVFTMCFLAEFIVRAMSRGFINTRHAYLSDGWNRLDFGILIFALIDISGLIPAANAGKVMRSARILSPLRLIKRNEGMRILINAFIGTLQPIGYVLLYTAVTFSVFAVLGMSFFGGRFYACSTPGAEYPGGKALCSGSHVLEVGGTAYMVPRSWLNPDYDFDDFSSSFKMVYRLGTIKYVSVMYAAMDVTAVDQSPLTDFSRWYAIYFVAFIILGAMFVSNIVAGFTVDGINANQGRTSADLRYSQQMKYMHAVSRGKHNIKPLANPASTTLRRYLDSSYFQAFSAACIAINAIFMLTDHADASAEFRAMMEIQNAIFFVELVAEVLLRVLAEGPRRFLDNKWNLFDAFIALGLIFTFVGAIGSFGQVGKGLRLIRILKLMLIIRPIRIVFDTILVTLPQLINVCGLLFLVMYSTAALGVALYSETRFQDKLGPAANFRDFAQAMRVIYQVLVGEEWMDLMADCSIEPPLCTPQFDGYTFGDCGSGIPAQFLFMFIKVVMHLMILNLLVGVILDNLNAIMNAVDHEETDEWTNGASFHQFKECAAVFNRFDAGTGKISLTCIRSLMREMPQPLGFRAKPPALGLKWMPMGNTHPHLDLEPTEWDGRDLDNWLLAEALSRKTEFTAEEWNAFGISHLQSGDFVKSGDTYFTPADQGELIYGAQERAFERLIRAELNLVAIENQSHAKLLQGRSRRKMTLWQFFKGAILGKKKPEKFSSSISFEQVMLTLMAWRTPHLMSIDVKRQRRLMLADVVYMSHALQVFDFLQTLLAKKVRQKVLSEGASRGRFLLWARADEHYTRRVGLKSDWTIYFRHYEKNHNGPLGTVDPLQVLSVCMLKIAKPPKGTILHREATYWNAEKISPFGGLELLLRKIPENTIFFKFVDGAHKDNGLVAIDFPEDCFEGWEEHVLRKDAFLEPPVRQMLVSKPRPWSRLDFVIQGKDDKDVPVGTLIDVQGFVAEDDTPDYAQLASNPAARFPPMTVAGVRLNLSKAFQRAAQTENDRGDPEIVLQVVGYLKRRKLHHAHAHHGAVGQLNSDD